MVKGCQRRVLHLKNPEGGLFEEAFFFLKAPDAPTGKNEGKTVTKILNLRLIEGVWYLDNYPNVVFPAGEN